MTTKFTRTLKVTYYEVIVMHKDTREVETLVIPAENERAAKKFVAQDENLIPVMSNFHHEETALYEMSLETFLANATKVEKE